MKKRSVGILIGFILLCEAVGAIGGLVTAESVPTWYTSLDKPGFTPPNWLFGPVWISLYLLMGIGIWMVWREYADEHNKRTAYLAFLIQLLLNGVWTPVFFGGHQLLIGLVIIVALWLSILFMIWAYRKVSPLAAWLQVPYLLWVSYATALNAALWWLNG